MSAAPLELVELAADALAEPVELWDELADTDEEPVAEELAEPEVALARAEDWDARAEERALEMVAERVALARAEEPYLVMV